jgi:Protein of unknown function (DUF3592)
MANTKNQDFKKIKRMIFGIIGIIIVITAGIWGWTIREFVNHSETAKGIVTKLNSGGSHPEIKITTKDGKEIEYPQGGLIFGYQVGDEVSVYYDPQNPKNCVLNSFGALWGFPLLAFTLGICFICATLLTSKSAL